MAESSKYLTVGALTSYLKAKFDQDPYLGKVYLTGEISNLGNRKGRHLYFSIKDPNGKAVIRATMFSYSSRLKFEPKEGMKVLAIGRVQVYEPSGSYSIILEQMTPDGVGDLFMALTQLKEKLTKEGLFTQPKRQLPLLPKKIAVITSPTGAVVEDVAKTVERRLPQAQVILLPAVVQGEGAVPSLLKQLDRVDQLGFDTAIIGRGGGSIEDLWAFNDEALVRKVAALKTPIISSVGHETDNTLVDLVADRRAATPTAAAELATPVTRQNIVDRLFELETRLVVAGKKTVQDRQNWLDQILNRPIMQQPDRLYAAYQQEVDQLVDRLSRGFQRQLDQKQYRFTKAGGRLVQQKQQILRPYQEALALASAKLDLVSPLKILASGYTIVRGPADKVIKKKGDLKVGDEVQLTFADGDVPAQIRGE
ncbi:exodeoxyribonuclease VII large subunit [Fructobacillus pseudoficulneus]|uniref:Exodeoxyribonuclease 7 large subunit n=1 Tax=Fructobacillus pseudoficulneus TaxID=220714 RepID=A0A3F3GVP7_9LACO|nr:exodeoxyribonuclease VII large subunit [Fructobacillus pseudoficulneus]GAP02377.1 exodeoxyribonuclease VII large subunit [Fructobacillus pseudoficulneus]SEH36565.1 Exodeoxyribonuclease VII large subunit [Fructobacillus pseudoficulneus]